MTAPTQPGAGTLGLQARLPATVLRLVQRYGQTVSIVRPGGPSGQYDADDRQLMLPDTETTVQGYLYELDVSQQAKLTAQGMQPPRFLLYLPYRLPDGSVVPVAQGGFAVLAQGQRYSPDTSAVDIGAQGVAWEIALRAPGDR